MITAIKNRMITAIFKKDRSDKRFLFVLGFVFCLVAGCATTQPQISYTTVTINNSPYFALAEMCDKENVTWDYDPLSKALVLKKDDHELRLLVGSKIILADNVIQEISGAIVAQDGVIYAPFDIRNYLQKPVCPVVPGKAGLKGPAYLRPVATVVLDAGHGGKDPGASGKHGLEEKGVVLDVVQNIKEDLERCGLKVYLTRSTDEFIQLYDRPKMANDKKADLFVSIHANASHSRWIEGVEVYYLTESVDDNARALAAAENYPAELPNQGFLYPSLPLKAILWDMIFTENRKESVELAQYISNAVAKKMDLKALGVRGAPFIVLKGAKMPAVLVEIGYISNNEGEKKLKNREYRQKMAQSIAQGILNFKSYSEGAWTNQ